MNSEPVVVAYLFHHPSLSGRSGMGPLVEALGARAVYYDVAWERLAARSWRLGQWVRRWGQRYSGSEWFAPWPWWDERRLLLALPRGRPSVAYYVFADFTPPMLVDRARRRGARLAATFHVSARRAERVLRGVRRLEDLDAVTLVSASQREYFLSRGVAPERLHVLPHGVDDRFFSPGPRGPRGEALRLLLVGKTERDHDLAIEVMNGLPPGTAELRVMTAPEHHARYRAARNVTVLPRLDDDALVGEYRQADLLFMPMLDCTANNVVLEAMACGTPVMINRVGGIPEYVDAGSNFILDGRDPDAWRDRLARLAGDRGTLEQRRPAVRAWAERFSWTRVAEEYRRLFRRLAGPAPEGAS